MKFFELLLFCCFTLFSQPLDSLLRAEISRAGYDTAGVGVLIAKPDGTTLATLNADKPFILASVQKIFTGGAAFDRLGHNHSFDTDIYLDSIDKVSGKVVGKFAIKGHGDPGFTAERLWLLTMHLKHQGIRELPDTIFLDNTFFDTVAIGPGFEDRMSSRAYMAPISPVSTNFNAVAVHVLPTKPGNPARIDLFPERADALIRGNINTIANGTTSGLKVSSSWNGTRTVVHASGTMNEGDKSRYIYRKVWDPVENFGSTFIAACRQVGISCSSTVVQAKVPVGLKLFYSFESEPLVKHVNGMFKYSNNFIAEMIFKSLDAEVNGRAGSWPGGVETVGEWVKLVTPDFGKLQMVNGSGMSKHNLATPYQLEKTLNYVLSQSSWSSEFMAALPVAGIDGTLKSRFKGSDLNGILRAKTGTLNSYGVSNLAGYLVTPQGNYPFVFLVNDRSKDLSRHWKLQEMVMSRLFTELGKL